MTAPVELGGRACRSSYWSANDSVQTINSRPVRTLHGTGPRFGHKGFVNSPLFCASTSFAEAFALSGFSGGFVVRVRYALFVNMLPIVLV